MKKKTTWWQRLREAMGGRRTGPRAEESTSQRQARERPSSEGQRAGAADLSGTVPTDRASSRVRSSGDRPPTDAILGLDLGTSSTKVVIRTPFLGGGRAVAVPVATPGDSPVSYLAPTAIVRRNDGTADIPLRQQVLGGWSSLKVAVMESPHNVESRARMAAYLAVIGRRAMRWFLESQRQVVGPYELRWRWNLGLPSNGCETESPVDAAFRDALVAARHLAEDDEPIRLEDAHKLIVEGSGQETAVDVVPEVVAEVVGYAHSHHREPGLHVLVDVGASTLDVCAFVLHESRGEDNYAILTALVERRGLHELHRARLEVLERLPRSQLRADRIDLDLSDPLVVIPGSVSDYLAPGSARERAEETDDRFKAGCVQQLMRCMVHLRRARYRSSPAWRTGIPVFLCGGGAASAFYEEALDAVSRSCVRSFADVAPLRGRPLPVPPQLDSPGLDATVFSRMAVAYGLSFDRFDIGEIVPPDQIPDEPPPRRRRGPDPITKDQV